jgi:hypothetical protein
MLSLLEKRLNKMSVTIFPSNPCYLPIYEAGNFGSLIKWTNIWLNFISANEKPVQFLNEKYKGRLIGDVIVFETEQDKMWFILRYS